MTRIIGGLAKGRRVATPAGMATRPTADRVREALFSAVESWCGSLHGLRFLDLYAGSGAVGLEAWSRGAGRVTVVEHHRRTAQLVETNARSLGAMPAVDVVEGRVATVLGSAPSAPYDVVFLDPPYSLAEDELATVLRSLVAHEWLVPGAMAVVERSSRSPAPTWPTGIAADRQRRYGETTLWYGHAARRPAGDGQDDGTEPGEARW